MAYSEGSEQSLPGTQGSGEENIRNKAKKVGQAQAEAG